MMNMIKQLLCRHEYRRIPDRLVKEGHFIRMRSVYKCAKCGKVIYK